MADRVGQRFGSYRLTRLLGQGGFADVYLGEHIYLNTQAAIKVLHVRLSGQDIEKFISEARILAHLVHPHIIRILDFGVESDTPFLVMDYAPNGTLRDLYQKGTRVSIDLVVGYVKQVAEALQYAHDKGLIHRDVKPGNMLLGHNLEVLLSDFGIATFVSNDDSAVSVTQETIGTATYMAPEQIMGKPRRASDQYALGIVVYEWLTGEGPFHGNYLETVTRHLYETPHFLHEKIPDIPSAVERTVMKALAKDPEARFNSVLSFAQALEQATGKVPAKTSIFFRVLRSLPHPILLPPQKHAPGKESIVPDIDVRANDLTVPTSATAYPLPKDGAQKVCPVCSTLIVTDDAFCPNCGASLSTTAISEPDSPTVQGMYYDASGTIGTRFDIGPNQTLAKSDVWSVAPPPPIEQTFIAPPPGDTVYAISPPPTVDKNVIAQLMQEGEKLYKARLFEDALKVYKHIIALDPHNVSAHGYKGNALGKLRLYREALAAYETALNIDEHHVSIWNATGDVLVKLGNYEEAISAYEEALKLSPKDVLTWSAKASAFARLKRYEEAVNAYEECLNFSHQDATIWVAKGNILTKLLRNEEALTDYNAALKLDPRNGLIWEAKGKVLVELQRYNEALDSYTKAIALLPKKTAVRVARSDVLARLERYDEALADCEHAQILNPKDRIIEKQCTMLRTLKQQKEALAQAQVQATQIVTPPPPADQAKTTVFPLNTIQFDQTKVQEGQHGYTKQASRSKQSSDNTADTKRFDVYLSHAPHDVDQVKKLAEHLEDQHGFHVWFGEWMQIPGQSWLQAIEKGLQQSHCCAVCIGTHPPIDWLKREMEWALSKQSESFRVIPVLLPNAPQEIENEIDEFLKQNILVDFRSGKYDFAFHALAQGVRGEPIGRWSPIDNTSTQTRSFAEVKLRELQGWVKEDIVDKNLSIKLQETILIQYWLGNDDTEGKGK